MTKKKDIKVRRKLFEVELEELLEKYDLFMDLRMSITQRGIKPLLIVDGVEKHKLKDVKKEK